MNGNAAKDTSSLTDQRDFSAFMNCEAPGKLTVEERVRLGPLPRVSTLGHHGQLPYSD